MATQQPLADRIRPTTLDEVVGQKHLVGKNGILRRLLESGRIPNMIFSGPPGTGKTTCANIIAKASGMRLVKLNATTASLSDIRDVTSSTGDLLSSQGVLLYLDEIQYFNKKQQQSLLEFLEDGRITMIASTTENPYLYVYNSILSRSSVFTFTEVSADECVPALRRALACLNETFSGKTKASDETLKNIALAGGGDVRMAISLLENAYYLAGDEITDEVTERLMKVAQQARCCIVCVIHQNKAAEDRTLRGSIGTELTNKAFEVYECEKLPSRTFVLTQKLTRKYDIVDALYFTVDDRGLPRQVGAPQTPAQIQSPQDTSLILFRQALAGHGRLSGDELRSKVMSAAGMTSFKLYGLLLDKALSDGLILKTVEKRHVYYSLARP